MNDEEPDYEEEEQVQNYVHSTAPIMRKRMLNEQTLHKRTRALNMFKLAERAINSQQVCSVKEKVHQEMKK